MANAESKGARIEQLLAAEDWSRARRAIRARLKSSPDDHWLLSRLALTHYEQRQYTKALELDRRAVRRAPGCPLALWGLAGTYQMLGRHSEAVSIYEHLIRKGAPALSKGPCGEGIRWARALVADCWFRLGQTRKAQDDIGRARAAYKKYLALRPTGSIYSAAEAKKALRDLRAARGGKQPGA